MAALAPPLLLLHGVVVRGPTQPVCRVGTPCSEPAAGVTLVFRGAGAAVRVRTDAQGRYAVRLRPGAYAVRAAPRPRIGRGISPARFTLRAPRRLDFDLDTGIRQSLRQGISVRAVLGHRQRNCGSRRRECGR